MHLDISIIMLTVILPYVLIAIQLPDRYYSSSLQSGIARPPFFLYVNGSAKEKTKNKKNEKQSSNNRLSSFSVFDLAFQVYIPHTIPMSYNQQQLNQLLIFHDHTLLQIGTYQLLAVHSAVQALNTDDRVYICMKMLVAELCM